MMFEELFSRKKQSNTTARQLPKEVDAIQKIRKGGKRTRHSSMAVDSYLWINRIVVGCIVLVGMVIIGSAAYGLISDFVSYSGGVPIGSSSTQPSAVESGE